MANKISDVLKSSKRAAVRHTIFGYVANKYVETTKTTIESTKTILIGSKKYRKGGVVC